MKKWIIACITAVMLAILPAAVAAAPSTTSATGLVTIAGQENGGNCAQVLNRHLEVCTAYVMNSSVESRLPYYQFGKDSNYAWASFFAYRLASRYQGQALAYVHNQTDGWPIGLPDVNIPHIKVDSVWVSADDSVARLRTHESWRVTEGGRLLLYEYNQPHVITMARVPGWILHKWIVTSIQ